MCVCFWARGLWVSPQLIACTNVPVSVAMLPSTPCAVADWYIWMDVRVVPVSILLCSDREKAAADTMFDTTENSGIDFDAYEDIPVEVGSGMAVC